VERSPRTTCHLVALTIDALDPSGLAGFWSGVLGRPVAEDPRGGVALLPPDDVGFVIRFAPTDVPKSVPDQMHFDLTSTSLDDQRATVERALALGGRHIDIGQGPEEEHVVLADPEGNEFCVLEPGNRFLAGCGFLGAVSSDGSQEVGRFWSRALAWPLVWDQDQETAVQSPRGGPKITWGGPPVRAKAGKNRLHLDLAPDAGSDRAAEVDRLLGLGASRVDVGQGDDAAWSVLADPDGNEFCVLDRG
jgi:hypothetical protein